MIFNVTGGGGGTGATLTVTAPAGCTVTVSKDGKTKTKTAGADGVAVFKGLATGTWTVTITDGEQTAQKTVTVTADYSTAITFFAATIHVTYPAGSTCTATDGVTILTAQDTSGTWDCVVPNAGMWNVLLDSGFAEAVEVTTNGETYTVDRWHLYNAGIWSCEYVQKTYYSGTVASNESNVTLKSSGENGSCAYVGARVNLSGVKTITAHYDSFSVSGTGDGLTNYITVFVTDSDTPTNLAGWNGNGTIASTRVGNYANEADVSLDISSAGISGYKYIWFGIYGTQGRYGTAVVSDFSFFCLSGGVTYDNLH